MPSIINFILIDNYNFEIVQIGTYDTVASAKLTGSTLFLSWINVSKKLIGGLFVIFVLCLPIHFALFLVKYMFMCCEF